ncbi:unnamed protein product [Gongylonema pulchrum]|uniref:Zinc/iron permease n=1 Tax=Gongylonema pulchrum TaxID=637853 RepID=A0A183DWZ6_9BILA|nr:unnamed protein product [Gongylonema pulchrum]
MELRMELMHLFAPAQPAPVPIIPVHGLLRAGLIVALFLATFCACLLAFLLRRIAITSTGYPAKVFSLLSVFGGGVFLATCLLDLLPDAFSTLRRVEKLEKFTYHYPIVETLIAVGFLLVLSTEQVFLFVREQSWIGSDGLEHLIAHSDDLSSNMPVADHMSVHSDYGSDIDLQCPSSHSSMHAVILAVACGTFLYITCFEILPHEFEQRQCRIVKLFALFAGFSLIACLMALFPDD